MPEMPELFAQNTKFLLAKFKGIKYFSQANLANTQLFCDPAALSRYLRGNDSRLDEEQYGKVAAYMVQKICNSETDTRLLCSAAGIVMFDYADEEARQKASDALLYAMRNKEFPVPDEPPVAVSATSEPEPVVPGKRSPILRYVGIAASIAAAVAVVIMLCIFLPRGEADVALDVAYYSPVGTAEAYVTGTVTASKGNPCDYKVTMAVMSPKDLRIYAPKPSALEPYVDVTAAEESGVGLYTLVFAPPGSDDIHSPRLFVYVIPADFIPNGDAERTRRAALDFVEINRE